MVEIGRPGDLRIEGLAGRKVMSETQFNDSQQYLEQHSSMIVQLELKTYRESGWRHRIAVPETGLLIGIMSKEFKDGIWEVAKKIGRNNSRTLRPGSTIKFVRAHGACTVVVGEDDPYIDTLLPEAARTGFLLSPMIASYSNVYLNPY